MVTRRKEEETALSLTIRELVFRAFCRHEQGDLPNILAFANRRSGSTWLVNTLAAHPGCRYVGKTLQVARQSRWGSSMPDLRKAAGADTEHEFQTVVSFAGADLEQFETLFRRIVETEIALYPTLRFRAPYFHRSTNRVIFKMTSGFPLIEWFDEKFDVETVILLRHPISNSLSIAAREWQPRAKDFLLHEQFVAENLTDRQVSRAWQIVESGSTLSQHVLEWCLMHMVPIRAFLSGAHPDWTLVTYEEMTVAPEETARLLAHRLDMDEVETLIDQIRRPSQNVTGASRNRLEEPSYLLCRWADRLDADEHRSLMQLAEEFDVGIYSSHTFFPNAEFLNVRTPEELRAAL